MISSGTKRGLAAVAVSALAVTGVPFLASSASAAPSALTLVGTGPTRDGGDIGGGVKLIAPGAVSGDEANLMLARTGDLTKDASDGTSQNVAIVNRQFVANGDPGDSNPSDGNPEINLTVRVDTAAPNTTGGGSFQYTVYNDTDGGGTSGAPDVDLNEARVNVSGTTVGQPANISISPATQTAPAGTPSGNYTVSITDSAGRATQLDLAETIGLSGTNAADPDGVGGPLTGTTNFYDGTTTPDVTITAADAVQGSATFQASNDVAGSYNLTATGAGGVVAAKTATARLTVVSGANLTTADVDFVTDADSYEAGDGFGAVAVRQDQKSITVDIDAGTDQAGATVVLNAHSLGSIKFDGKTDKPFTTVLDAQGKGTIVITPDAGTVTTNSQFELSGSGISTTTFTFQAAKPSTIKVPATFVSAYAGSVDVTATVLDQFGLPATGAYVDARRTGGANADTSATARKAVDADGQVTFTFTDTKASAASHATDTVTLRAYKDAFDTVVQTTATTKIEYTANGQGGDFALTFDNIPTEGGTYDPATVSINPLTDAKRDNLAAPAGDSTDESVVLGLVGATPGAPVTVSADNGALVVKNPATPNALTTGAASQSGTDADTFQVVGTKEGLVTVTVTSAGVTKTAQFTVKPSVNAANTARNIAVTAPEGTVVSGGLATFTVKVTDAFGNPVAGVQSAFGMNFQVSGPGSVQDYDPQTDANGELKVNVRVNEGASTPITLRVMGVPAFAGAQFGADANQYQAGSLANSAPGLSASTSSASATVSDVTNVQELEQAVADAQDAVDAAQDDVDAAKGDRVVAQTAKKVAQHNVKAAKKALKRAKHRHSHVVESRRALRVAKGDLKVAAAKVKVEKKQVHQAKAALADAKQALADAQQALEDAQNGEG